MQQLVLSLLFLCFYLSSNAYADHRAIHVAVDHAPPYSSVSNEGESSGLILDIIRATAANKYQVRAVPCPVSRCLRMLEQGEVDVMGGLIKTPARQNSMVFVDPPYMAFSSSYVFYAQKGSDLSVSRFEDLYGKRIAVMRGAAFFERFDQDKKLNKVDVTSEQVALDLVLKGRVDLAIAIEDTAEVAMKVLKQPISQLEKMHYRHTNVIYGYMAFSRKFSQTHAAEDIKENMQELAKNKLLDKLIAPYALPPIPPELMQ
ncbi:substrate-binding periplasmic protein [Pseudoalteromonas sp. S16_S37]|uniref:substrate-binding periplasmic protein n=1 Tax=Pseudoalteromonas sp. S16_S37 TaxID=2720228 RepID=UPI001EEE1355|nr:transporter substrate-binding domain-containing protein [Pseudoalteromonas sp. S16_S37]